MVIYGTQHGAFADALAISLRVKQGHGKWRVASRVMHYNIIQIIIQMFSSNFKWNFTGKIKAINVSQTIVTALLLTVFSGIQTPIR